MIKLEDINIRTSIKPGDIGYITYLHGDVYEREYGFGLEFEAYVAETLAEFIRQFDVAKDRVWICEYENRIIGFLSMYGRENQAQLRYFILLPEFRGIGLGKKLMSLFVDSMKECQFSNAYLLTTERLKAAVGLYEKFGFTLIEERKSIGFSVPETELRYELQLS
ncbi:MAG: GNAT family N-acetyltransferase [Bacteroidota bacterium]